MAKQYTRLKIEEDIGEKIQRIKEAEKEEVGQVTTSSLINRMADAYIMLKSRNQ